MLVPITQVSAETDTWLFLKDNRGKSLNYEKVKQHKTEHMDQRSQGAGTTPEIGQHGREWRLTLLPQSTAWFKDIHVRLTGHVCEVDEVL